MKHELKMGDDGILRITFIGDLGDDELEPYLAAFQPYLEAATNESPLRILADSTRAGKVSSKARKALAGMQKDLRVEKVAIIGANRYVRVLTGFIFKAVGREEIIRFFELEDEALAWLQANS